MNIEIKVPQLPESVTDATLLVWHRKAGQSVRRDDNLVDLETDKVVLEVPSPSDGILKEIKLDSGATVSTGQVLAILEPGEQPAVDDEVSEPSAVAEGPAAEAAVGLDSDDQRGSAGKMGPAARKLVEEHDLDPAGIVGSGRDGRVTKADVLVHLAGEGEVSDDQHALAVSLAGASESEGRSRVEQRVPMTRLRARIAERLVEAQRQAAMLTTFNEVDMSAIIELRKRYREPFQTRHGIKLGFMPFFVRASIEALREYPLLNASVDEQDVLYHEYFDIGVAVSTDRGLLVPVLRDAQALSFAEIERQIRDFGERAKSGTIALEELTGGTFTITNGGIFGSLNSTPILNPPQSGILGMHAIQQRPVVVDGAIVARPMMNLALTYDHRIIDGRDAVQFLVYLKQQLEDPARLVLQV